MINKLVYRIIRRRHFWRDADYSELGEVYVSMVLRSLALSLTGIFVPIYMLKLHYDVVAILSLFFWYMFGRAVLFDMLAGQMVGRIGPKHTIIFSYGLLIVSMLQFMTLPSAHWPIWLLGTMWGSTISFYCIPYHVHFSKIKHAEHGGKELGYANIMDKSGSIIGPIISGIVATLCGGQYIFIFAVIALIAGSIPLLRTAETIPPHRRFHLQFVRFRPIRRDIIAFNFNNLEQMTGGMLWPMFLSIFVLSRGTAYAKLGFIASVSVLASMFAAYSIGKLIDKDRGRLLLRFGASANALLYCFRLTPITYPIAILINVVYENLAVCYRLPFIKGMYGAADGQSIRYRVGYYTLLENTSSLTKAAFYLVLIFIAQTYSARAAFTTGFVFAGICALLMMTERFRVLSNDEVTHRPVVYKPTKPVSV